MAIIPPLDLSGWNTPITPMQDAFGRNLPVPDFTQGGYANWDGTKWVYGGQSSNPVTPPTPTPAPSPTPTPTPIQPSPLPTPSPTTPGWYSPTNWIVNGVNDRSLFPSAPPTPPTGKLNFTDWYNQMGKNMAQSVSFGSPAASYLDYIGYNRSGASGGSPTTTSPTTPVTPPATMPTTMESGNQPWKNAAASDINPITGKPYDYQWNYTAGFSNQNPTGGIVQQPLKLTPEQQADPTINPSGLGLPSVNPFQSSAPPPSQSSEQSTTPVTAPDLSVESALSNIASNQPGYVASPNAPVSNPFSGFNYGSSAAKPMKTTGTEFSNIPIGLYSNQKRR